MARSLKVYLSLSKWTDSSALGRAWEHHYNEVYTDTVVNGTVEGVTQAINTVNNKIVEIYHGRWVTDECFEFDNEQSLVAFLLMWEKEFVQ